MGLIAVAERIVEVPVDVAFTHFCNFSEWDRWAPRTFLPVNGPARVLREGDQLRVGVGPASLDLQVIRVRPNKELCLRGGFSGMLHGDRSFLFSDDGGKTRLRCEEPLDGFLTVGPLGALTERRLVKAAGDLLDRFAKYCQTCSH